MDDGREKGRPGARGPLGVIAISAVVVSATGALLAFSWVRQSRLERELARARALVDEARVRLGRTPDASASRKAVARDSKETLDLLVKERAEVARLAKEHAELERLSGEKTLELEGLDLRIARFREEVHRLTSEPREGRARGSAARPRASDAEDAGDVFQEHLRLMDETRALRDRLRRMIHAFEELMLDEVTRRSP